MYFIHAKMGAKGLDMVICDKCVVARPIIYWMNLYCVMHGAVHIYSGTQHQNLHVQ